MRNSSLKYALTLPVIILLIGFPQISETIYTPSLPSIAAALHTTNHLVQWTLSVYFIGFALGTLIWGQVSDRIGRRPVMLIGIVFYIVASVLCAFASSIHALLGWRILQAFGASVGSVITQAMMREGLEDDKRHHAY